MSTQFAIKRWSMGKVIIHANILCSDVICFQPPCWVFDKGLKAKRNLQLPKKKYYNNNAIEKNKENLLCCLTRLTMKRKHVANRRIALQDIRP
jgi:hypothetical protein